MPCQIIINNKYPIEKTTTLFLKVSFLNVKIVISLSNIVPQVLIAKNERIIKINNNPTII